MKEIDKLLFENGMVIDSEDEDAPLEMDSITFASLVISIENHYGITVPANMLLYEKWKTKTMIEKNIAYLQSIASKNKTETAFLDIAKSEFI